MKICMDRFMMQNGPFDERESLTKIQPHKNKNNRCLLTCNNKPENVQLYSIIMSFNIN